MKDREGLRDKLRAIIQRESEKAIGRSGSVLSEERSTLKRRYLGYGYGDDDKRAQRGLSTYVDRTVMEVVEWAKPGLLRVFSGDEIVRFDPRRQEDERAAADATTYINQVCFGRSMFRLVHDTLADGLYQRVGWCIAHAPRRMERTVEKYTGITQEEAISILSDPGIDLEAGGVEIVRYEVPLASIPLERRPQPGPGMALHQQGAAPALPAPGQAPQGAQPQAPQNGPAQPGTPPQAQNMPNAAQQPQMPQNAPQNGPQAANMPMPAPQPSPMDMAPMLPGMPEPPDRTEPEMVTLFDLTVHKSVERRDIRIDPVPSEQVIISGDAVDVEHARFVAHWEKKTASDLRKEGYSQEEIDELPQFDSSDEMPETTVARRINAESDDYDDGLTGATREYKVYEAWLDCDINGDGIAEKVKVTYVGDSSRVHVLDFEEWPLYRAPLFAACSVPVPHQVVGLCVADLVSDLQDLRSELTRNLLDNLALSNSSELVVNEGTPGVGEVEYDSLLSRQVGGVIRLKGDASITPIPVTSAAADTLSGLTMASDLIERRTGISSRTQSIKADTLQNTATGASIQEEALNQRLELVARVYAETFFKPLGRYLLHLVHKYHDKEMQLRLKGRFMTFDPRKWDPDMEISVTVGLGTGDRSKLLGTYQSILQIQQAFMQQLGQSSPVHLPHIVYTCHKLAEAAGLEAPERFFGTEEDARDAEMRQAMQPPQENPAVALEREKAQAKMQADVQKAQAQIQIQREKAQQDSALRAQEMQAKMQLRREETEQKMRLRSQEMATEAQLDATRLALGGRGSGLTNVRGI